MAAATCPACGEDAVYWEEYSQQITDHKPQQICTECGLVLEEGCYSSEATEGTIDIKPRRHLYESSLPTNYLQRNKTEYESKAKKRYEKIIQNLADSFDLPGCIIDETKEVFGNLFSSEYFRNVAVENKCIAAGCCLFAVCRRNDLPMLIRFFTDLLNCGSDKFGKQLRRVLAITNLKLPSQDISDYVDGYCTRLNVSEEVRSTTMDIIQLAKKTWISQGRRTESVLAAAVYIAWVTEEPTNRLKVTLNKFFKLQVFKCGELKTAKHRLQELLSVISTLAKEIPWVDAKKPDLKTTVFNLRDVIKYQQSLIHESSLRVGISRKTKSNLNQSDEASDSNAETVDQIDTNTSRTLEDVGVAHTNSSENRIVSDTTASNPVSVPCKSERSQTLEQQPLTKLDSVDCGLSTTCSSTKATSCTSVKSESSGLIRRQTSLVLGTVYVDNGAYDSIAPLPSVKCKTDPGESEPRNEDQTELSSGISKSSEDTKETNEPVLNDGSQVIKELKSCNSSKRTDSPSGVCDGGADIENASDETSDSVSVPYLDGLNDDSNDSDRTAVERTVTLENHGDQDNDSSASMVTDISSSKSLRYLTRKRKREIHKTNSRELLPVSYIITRQISKERKKLKVGETESRVNAIKVEMTDKEIDEDIEQYLRSDTEIDFVKRLRQKTV